MQTIKNLYEDLFSVRRYQAGMPHTMSLWGAGDQPGYWCERPSKGRRNPAAGPVASADKPFPGLFEMIHMMIWPSGARMFTGPGSFSLSIHSCSLVGYKRPCRG